MSLISSPTRFEPHGDDPRPARPGARRRRGHPALAGCVVALSLALAALLAFHRSIPDAGGVGLLVDSLIPWFGLLLPVLLILGLASRRAFSLVAVLVPTLAWALLFGPSIAPLSWTGAAGSSASGSAESVAGATTSALTVASQNIEASSGTGVTSARTLADTGADVIALEEMTDADFDSISSTLANQYPHSFGVGTVGLWSKYPIVNAQPLNLGLGWNRALAADLDTPQGLVSIYVIHAASARPGDVSARNSMLTALAETLPNDENERVIAVGDFNAASTDRAMGGIYSQLAEPNQTSGMFGDTWPSNLPLTRLDHLLQRGMTVSSNTTLAAGDSDHRALLTTLTL